MANTKIRQDKMFVPKLTILFLLALPMINASCSGGNSCCSSRSPCGLGEGDCDSDSECTGDLICAKGYTVGCKKGANWDSSDDCCLDPRKLPADIVDAHKFIQGAEYIGVPGTNLNVAALSEGIVDFFGRRK